MIPDTSFCARFSYCSEESICTQGATEREWTPIDESQLSRVIILGMSQPVQQGSHHNFTATQDIMLSISTDRGGNSVSQKLDDFLSNWGQNWPGAWVPPSSALPPSPMEAGKHGPMDGVEGKQSDADHASCVEWGLHGRRHGATWLMKNASSKK